MKRVLMIAYHFPPIKVSSGIQRTLRFAQYLPENGWSPIVLAPHPRAYIATSDEDMGQLAGMEVHRTFALDSGRHLSLRGRYPRLAALPDRWSSWWLGAVPAGLNLIRKFRPHVIWSTYPIATAHLIGLTLHRLTGIPWAADFRDPMVQVDYPPDPLTWKSFHWIERQTAKHASAIIFTTPGALREYGRRYPDRAGRFSLIENGYDENMFATASRGLEIAPRLPGRPVTLLHSGIIYPIERDPRQLFAALSHLLRQGEISPDVLRIVLRASGHDTYLRELIGHFGIESIVTLAPSIPYAAALREMLTVDGLLILQADNCNDQIPAKLYEYLRARRPILGLADPEGDTGQVLAAAGIDTIAPLDSAEAIATALKRFIERFRNGNIQLPHEATITSASRRGRTLEFSRMLDTMVTSSR